MEPGMANIVVIVGLDRKMGPFLIKEPILPRACSAPLPYSQEHYHKVRNAVTMKVDHRQGLVRLKILEK